MPASQNQTPSATTRELRSAKSADLRARARTACETATLRVTRAARVLDRSVELKTSTTETGPRASGAGSDLRARLRQAEHQTEHLNRALETNRRIGMAIGILMRELRCTEEQAFDLLRKGSMQSNVKLRDVAERVIYTGTM